jgi:fibro-slime domain-containing protein
MSFLSNLSQAQKAALTLSAAALATGACGNAAPVGVGGNPSGAGGGGGFFTPVGGSGGGGATYGDAGIPPNTVFTPGELGAYALGQEITGSGLANTGVAAANQACNTIAGVVRDFKFAASPGGHPDFEKFSGTGATLGMVANALGADGKPVYTGVCEAAGKTAACPSGQQTTSKANFDQWYRFTDGVNKAFIIYLQFAPSTSSTGAPIMTFQSHTYFPIDNAGWGNEGKAHNYAFTTEIHTKFKYGGGETFTFIGDDDVWVFVNGHLAVDLGGLHPEANATIDLDQSAANLGITKGQEYRLDLFHAERHTTESNFRIDTNFAFTDCGTTIPPDIK